MNQLHFSARLRATYARTARWWQSHVPQYGWRPLLRLGGLLGAAGIAGALLVSYAGIYNIAASHQHPGWMTWFLQLSMERSVKVQAAGIKVPALDQTDLVPLGAAHFAGTCALCHAAPGQAKNPMFDAMLPSPPRLNNVANEWTDAQLYWIVFHGIQFSGMPSWSGKGREDEVWSTVAFLKALPAMSAEQYRAYANGNVLPPTRAAGDQVRAGNYQTELTACNRCHDTQRMPPTSSWVPRLAGQTEAYLLRSLLEYQNDHRQSGVMEPVAAALDEQQAAELARYYAALESPLHPRQLEIAAAELARGRQLASAGDPARDIPACDSCHGPDARLDYPRLAGQSRNYQVMQLELWRGGGRLGSKHGLTMAKIAQRMTPAQVGAVSAYYSRSEPAAAAVRVQP